MFAGQLKAPVRLSESPAWLSPPPQCTMKNRISSPRADQQQFFPDVEPRLMTAGRMFSARCGIAAIALVTLAATSPPAGAQTQRSIESRIDSVLALMTLEEKVG